MVQEEVYMPILQIRGTSGSGKSWVLRKVMELTRGWRAVTPSGRRRPLYYVRETAGEQVSAMILGHYETACGGCDAVGSAPAVYDLTLAVLDEHIDPLDLESVVGVRPPGPTVLCEGLLLSEDVRWTVRLRDRGLDVRCLFLTTPVETCLEQIRGRRTEAGDTRPLSEYKTRSRADAIERVRVRLTEAGVPCRRLSAGQAPGVILSMIGVPGRTPSCL